MYRRVLIALLFAVGGSASATTLDLLGTSSVALAHGDQLAIRFSVWNYGWNNPGVSPYPT